MLTPFTMKTLFRYLFFGILLLIPEAYASDSSPDNPTRYSIVVGAGPQWVRTDLTGDLSKAGSILLSEVLMEKDVGEFGFLGLGLGFQRASQSGRTLLREQVLAVNNPIIDLVLSKPVFRPDFEIGGVARNMFGSGAYFDFTKRDSFQWLLSVGPQLRYRHALDGGAEIVGSLGFLMDLTSPNHSVWQVPLQISYVFPMSGSTQSAAPAAP